MDSFEIRQKFERNAKRSKSVIDRLELEAEEFWMKNARLRNELKQKNNENVFLEGNYGDLKQKYKDLEEKHRRNMNAVDRFLCGFTKRFQLFFEEHRNGHGNNGNGKRKGGGSGSGSREKSESTDFDLQQKADGSGAEDMTNNLLCFGDAQPYLTLKYAEMEGFLSKISRLVLEKEIRRKARSSARRSWR